ncbi:MAG: phosphoenolpyruvate carboxykinase [Pelagibacterium sp.]|uniref:phosphoenolpyruvate carboxykinase n=1 Tax=Pelagibacterium sp. TaxID=1967288 RepID=UPI0032EB5139
MTATTCQSLARSVAANAASVRFNDTAPILVETAIAHKQGLLSADGAFVADTGKFTGRSPSDKFIVRDDLTENLVWWDNTKALDPARFDTLLADFTASLEGADLFDQQLFAGADLKHQLNVEVLTPSAWHALFIRNLLIRPARAGLTGFAPHVTILHNPAFKADPARHGTRSETVIALDLSRNIVLIGGTAYAGEIKKSVFSLFNFHAPSDGVLPMHCSANTGKDGDTALFFGLSGTGKTTLSTDPERILIGDDEHGWSDDGVFNLEGGCYAKTINLSAKAEPEIFGATKRFGTVLENVVLDEHSREPDFNDGSKTENTRAAYPLYVLDNVSRTGTGPTPTNIVLLTADAFGVLPPIARLSPEQAIYHFLSGYTAKVAGTERGVTEPEATFSACFGAPFMSLHPTVYGRMLKKRIRESLAECWLINTGWTGGAYGVGKRISIKDTRRLLNAALSGELINVPARIDPVFGFAVPLAVEGVDSKLLTPRETWEDKAAYDRQSARLVSLFEANFEKFAAADAQIAEAGPRLAVAAE